MRLVNFGIGCWMDPVLRVECSVVRSNLEESHGRKLTVCPLVARMLTGQWGHGSLNHSP